MAISKARERALAEAKRAEDNARRLRRLAIWSVVAITAVAGWESYGHIVYVCTHHGESTSVAHGMPILIDGLMTVTGISIIVANAPGMTSAKWSFLFGLFCSLGANVLAAQPSPVGYFLAGVPSIALLVGTHELLKLLIPRPKRRPRRRTPGKPVQKAATAPMAKKVTRVHPAPNLAVVTS